MKTFHNDIAIKEKYVARVKAHQEADKIIKGKYWEEGKGCAVGCTIEGNKHNRYETELGLPEWLARLEDILFEGMPNEDAMKFPLRFLEAIPVGVELDKVKWQFSAYLMKENIERVLLLNIDEILKEQVLKAIKDVLSLNENAIETGIWDASAARSVESVAKSARSAAESAAESVAESVAESAWSAESAASSAAESVAESAWSAEAAAWSAARSAGSAESVARSAAFLKHSKKLLELLRKAI